MAKNGAKGDVAGYWASDRRLLCGKITPGVL